MSTECLYCYNVDITSLHKCCNIYMCYECILTNMEVKGMIYPICVECESFITSLMTYNFCEKVIPMLMKGSHPDIEERIAISIKRNNELNEKNKEMRLNKGKVKRIISDFIANDCDIEVISVEDLRILSLDTLLNRADVREYRRNNATVIDSVNKYFNKYGIDESNKCLNTGCIGTMQNGRCIICKKQYCTKCRIVHSNNNHQCDPDDISMLNLINTEIHQCPNCSILISKIHGCDNMRCTECGIGFSWKTGHILTNDFHNPHNNEVRTKSMTSKYANLAVIKMQFDNPVYDRIVEFLGTNYDFSLEVAKRQLFIKVAKSLRALNIYTESQTYAVILDSILILWDIMIVNMKLNELKDKCHKVLDHDLEYVSEMPNWYQSFNKEISSCLLSTTHCSLLDTWKIKWSEIFIRK
jgi:hypothetical protein